MNFLFYAGHPAHYHNVSVVMKKLVAKGHKVCLVARDKDVLFELLENIEIPTFYLKARSSNSMIGIVLSVLLREIQLIRIFKKVKVDLVVGTDISITHVAKLLGVKSILLNEDDVDQIPLWTKYGVPYASCVLSPTSCAIGKYEKKTITYNGFHELAYLAPNYFKPDKNRVIDLTKKSENFFIIRLSALTAHHDVGRKGISTEITRNIIRLLEPFGTVYITAEKPLEQEFERYRITIGPKDIHHALYFAKMYIGDSQTMTAEAAVLGTPSLRFNDFVGKLGYLEKLEEYELTYGIKTTEPEKLLALITELLEIPELKSLWEQRKNRMLSEQIDVAQFWATFFENFPASMREIKAKNK